MKPADLKAPFAWNARRVLISDRIFYVPTRCETYDDFCFPGWNHPDLFDNDNPIHIEYCMGNGAWIAEKALANPNCNWIGVEKKFMRVRKGWSKIKNLNLKNLVIVCGEAYGATWRYFPPESFSAAYINFPDPWPKKRHAKNRLVQPRFVNEIWRVLKPDTVFTLVTDDPEYSERMIFEMQAHQGFESLHPELSYTTEMQGYGTSFFDELWRNKGKVIRYHQFRKILHA